MRHTFAGAAALLVLPALAGCGSSATSTSPATSSSPPISLLDPAADPGPGHLVEPSDDDPVPHDTSDETLEAATRAILDALAGEGLLVTSIDAELTEQLDDRAQVIVDVAHTLGRDHPHQARYDLDLTGTADGWQVTQLEQTDS